MFKAGIVDPTKVTRSALQNAASIAGLMLTTEVMVTKIDEDEPRSQGRRGDRANGEVGASGQWSGCRGEADGPADRLPAYLDSDH